MSKFLYLICFCVIIMSFSFCPGTPDESVSTKSLAANVTPSLTDDVLTEKVIDSIKGTACNCIKCTCVKAKCDCGSCNCDKVVVLSVIPPDAGVPPLPDVSTASDISVVPDVAVIPDVAPPEPDIGPVPTPSDRLPTFVDLDWTDFPSDPGPNYVVVGKTIVVKKTGKDTNAGTEASPFLTIVKAVSVSDVGDMIKVYGGTYKEAIKDDYRALVLRKDNLVLTAAPGQIVTVEPDLGFKYGIEIAASGIILNGINLNGFIYSISVGGNTKPQTNTVISNLNITAPTSSSAGIAAFYNTNSKGFPTSKGLLVKNVVITGAGMGISCDSGPCHSWRIEDTKVLGAGGSGWGSDGIAIENGENLLFYRVEVAGFGADGIDTKANKVVVWDCNVHNMQKNGIKMWHGGDIVNTIVHHTGADASIVTEYGPRLRILHSIVAFHNYNSGSSYNMTFGYGPQDAQQIEIIDSIIYNTSGGAYINGNSQLTIENSIFFGMQNGNILSYGSKDITISQGASGLAQFGSGNIVANPQLNETTFELKSTSPGINKGKKLSVNYPDFDILGRPRVKSGVCDISPFEGY